MLSDLDDDTLRHILQLSPLTALPAAACVSKGWHTLANEGEWQGATSEPLRRLRGRSALLCAEHSMRAADGDDPSVVMCGDPAAANDYMMRAQALRFARKLSQHAPVVHRLVHLYDEFEEKAVKYTCQLLALRDAVDTDHALPSIDELLPLYLTLLLPAIHAAREPLASYRSHRPPRKPPTNPLPSDAHVPTIALPFDDAADGAALLISTRPPGEEVSFNGLVQPSRAKTYMYADGCTPAPPLDAVIKVGSRLAAVFTRFAPLLIAHTDLLITRPAPSNPLRPLHPLQPLLLTRPTTEATRGSSEAALPPRWPSLLRDLSKLLTMEADLRHRGGDLGEISTASSASSRAPCIRAAEAARAVDAIWHQLNAELKRAESPQERRWRGRGTSGATSPDAHAGAATWAQWLRGWVQGHW